MVLMSCFNQWNVIWCNIYLKHGRHNIRALVNKNICTRALYTLDHFRYVFIIITFMIITIVIITTEWKKIRWHMRFFLQVSLLWENFALIHAHDNSLLLCERFIKVSLWIQQMVCLDDFQILMLNELIDFG